MEEKDEKPAVGTPETGAAAETKEKEIDLNSLFPGKNCDLNRLFPDEATRRLLSQVKKNKRDIQRFIKNLDVEEE